VLLVGLGRLLQDLLLWCTMEVQYLRLPDGFVQGSSIMPQKRNPVGLEHARAIASKALAQASGVAMAVHNTPFGDIVDTEDDLQPLVASAFRDTIRAVRLVAAVMKGAEFNRELMEARARANWITITELADTLTRQHGLPFRHSHAIAVRLIAERERHPEAPLGRLLVQAAADVCGAHVQYSDDELQELLSPQHFVSVRSAPGGPAPDETARAIAASAAVLAGDRTWMAQTRAALEEAEGRLREAAAAL
jgi:argininosuccinate lyase